jgi:hypothetical protein
VLFAFPKSPEFWRLPAADEVLTTGFWSLLRPRGGTLLHPVWPSPHYEDVIVIVSDVISDKPPPFFPGGRDGAVPSRKPVEPAVPSPPSEPAAPAPPPEQGKPEEVPDAKGWIAAEARRMKVAGELSGIGITDFAKELARRMKEEAGKKEPLHPVKRPVKWTYIKNKLPDWGLWPVSCIE